MPRRSSVMLTPSQNRKSTKLQFDTIASGVNADKNNEERTSSLQFITTTSTTDNKSDNIFSASALSRKRVRNSTNNYNFNYDEDDGVGVGDNEEYTSENKCPQRWSYVRESVVVEPKDNTEARFSISDNATYHPDTFIASGSAINENYNINTSRNSNNNISNIDARKNDASLFDVHYEPHIHNYSHASTISSHPARSYLENMAPLYVRVGVLPLPFTTTSTNRQTETEQGSVIGTRLESDKSKATKETSASMKQSWCKGKLSFIERLLRPRRFFQLPSLSPQRRHTRSYDTINSNSDYDAYTMSNVVVVEDEEQNNIEVLGWSGKYCNVALPLSQLEVPCHALKIAKKDGDTKINSDTSYGENKIADKHKNSISSFAIKTALSITVVLEPLINNNNDDDGNDDVNNLDNENRI